MPRIAPIAVGTPPFLTRPVSWLFTRASPGLIHERGNLTLPHDLPGSGFRQPPPLFLFLFYRQTTSGEVGLSPINASSRNHGGIWGFFFYACWMCHLISTATLKNATPRRVDRSNWDGLRG